MHEQLFEKLESDRFSATMNVVSGLKPFLRALASAPEVQALLASLRSSADLSAVAERFNQVIDRATDPSYENPWDVAIAAYLLVLHEVDRRQAANCAERALNCPNCWWSTKVADQILSGDRVDQLEQMQGRSPISTRT
jgi:hypothetical protein